MHAFDLVTGQDQHREIPAWIGSDALTASGAYVAPCNGLQALDFQHGYLEFRAPAPSMPRR